MSDPSGAGGLPADGDLPPPPGVEDIMAEAAMADDLLPDGTSVFGEPSAAPAGDPADDRGPVPSIAEAMAAARAKAAAEAADVDDTTSPTAVPTLEGGEDGLLSPHELMLQTVTEERDNYLDALQRLKAEFSNHRRRAGEQAETQRQQAAAGLVQKLVPVFDSCDAAMAHAPEAVGPIYDELIEVLSRDGLERLEPVGEEFNPEWHEAVLHEPAGDGDAAGPIVADVLRVGWAWNGRVIRPAMVKVRG